MADENKQKSIRQIIEDQNALLSEQLRIIKDQAGIDSDRVNDQQDIANVLKDQLKSLQFQSSEKNLIRKITTEINNITAKNYEIGKNELGTLKGVQALQKDRVTLENKIRLLNQQKLKFQNLSKNSVGEEAQLYGDVAITIKEQIDEITRLNKELGKVEDASERINKNMAVKSFSGAADLFKSIPGLRQFSEPLSKAAEASRSMASGIEQAAMSGGKGLTKERIKQLGLEKQLNGLAGAAAAQKIKGMSTFNKNILIAKVGFKALGGIIKVALAPLALLSFIQALMESDRAASDLAKTLGTSYSNALDLRLEMTAFAAETDKVFVTTKGLQETLSAINTTLGTNAFYLDDNVALMTELRKTAGLTNEELVALNALTLTNGKSLEENTQEVLGQVIALNASTNSAVSQQQVLKDIKDVSAATTLSFSKNPALIAESVATARRLGLELSKVEGIADSLLDFESSITSELQAELLIGRDINLEKARQAALNNDLTTAAEEIAKQAGSAADFAEMNRIQQDALAKSVGMSREELAKMLFLQEQQAAVGAKSAEERELVEQRIRQLENQGLSQAQIRKKLGEESLKDLQNQASVGDQFGAAIEKFKELFVAIAPAVLNIANTIMPIFNALGYIVKPIAALINGANQLSGVLGTVVGLLTAAGIAALVLNSSLTFGVGAAIALAAVGAGMSLLKSNKDEATKVGDVFSPSKGKTQISTKEGGLFELSKNDDVIAAPGVASRMQQSNQSTVIQQDNSETNNLLKQLIATNSKGYDKLDKKQEISPVGLYEIA
jgi:hypothetical protein